MSEEQLARQLISLHRAVSHRDKQFLRQLVRRCDNKLDMSLPLRGVTALSLSIYLKHPDMASELLGIMKQNRQIGNFPNQFYYGQTPTSFQLILNETNRNILQRNESSKQMIKFSYFMQAVQTFTTITRSFILPTMFFND